MDLFPLGADLFEYLLTEGICECRIKFCSKSKREGESKTVLKPRPQQTQVYETSVSANIEILNNCICGGVSVYI